jgi:hypothetical protein
VPQGNPLGESALKVLMEEGQAAVTRGLLQIARHVRKIEIVNREREPKPGGKRTDEFGIAAGSVAPQIVVDVHHTEAQVPPRRKIEQNVQKAHGIRPAGHSDSNAIAGREHAMALDGLDHAVEQDDFIVGLDASSDAARALT